MPVDRETRERQAAAIVASCLGAKYKRLDQHDHDFDLCYSDDHVEPLEVTTAATEGAIGTEVELQRDPTRAAPQLMNVWTLVPEMAITTGPETRSGRRQTERYPLDDRHPLIVERLAVLEGESVTQVPGKWGSYPEPVNRAISELARLGAPIGSCRPCEPGEAPMVEYIGSFGGVGRAELLLAAIKPEYTDVGNAAKLSGPGRRRHLFIRVDHTAGDAYVALQHGELPEELPDLPAQITDLWLWADSLRVFHFTPEGGWTDHAIRQDVVVRPESLSA